MVKYEHNLERSQPMPNIFSPFWDESTGSCQKHGIPELPCEQCLAERDANITVRLTEMDRAILDFEEPGVTTARDLLPADHADWLVARIEN